MYNHPIEHNREYSNIYQNLVCAYKLFLAGKISLIILFEVLERINAEK